MAIRWNKAKHGSYQDKYDFVEYLMCNGPQLDADTILHYRAKAYSDPVCMEIAYSYLSDVEYISQVRQQKYGKETDNCFKNPCFYMGKFSAMMGNCGDTENTRTAFNCIARWWQAKFGDGKEQEIIQEQQINNGQRVTNDAAAENKTRAAEEEVKKKAGQTDAKPLGTDTKVNPAGNVSVPNAANPTIQPAPPPGMIRKCFMQVLHPSIVQGWGKWWSQVSSAGEAFSEDFMKCTNTALMAGKIGDYLSQPVSEMLDMVTKANVKRQLGDCARLWSHVRRFRLFGSDNKYGPVVANQLVGDTNTDGTPTETVANPQPKAGDSTKPLKRRNKKRGGKKKGTKKNDPYAKYRTASGAIDMDKLRQGDPALYQKTMAQWQDSNKHKDDAGFYHQTEEDKKRANAEYRGDFSASRDNTDAKAEQKKKEAETKAIAAANAQVATQNSYANSATLSGYVPPITYNPNFGAASSGPLDTSVGTKKIDPLNIAQNINL